MRCHLKFIAQSTLRQFGKEDELTVCRYYTLTREGAYENCSKLYVEDKLHDVFLFAHSPDLL